MKRILVFLLFLVYFSAFAEELTPEQIIDKSLEHKTFSYENSEAKIKMILIDKDKNKEERGVVIKSKTTDKTTKTISVFSGGAEVNGVKFLSFEKNDETEQYVYYPAQNKVNRIISKSNKSERFLSTDFTYYDLEGNYRKNATFTKLTDEKVGTFDCYVIDAIPKKDEDSIYSKVTIYIRKDDYIPIKIKFYNKNKEFYKEYIVKKIKTENNKKIISLSQMVDKTRKHATLLELETINLDAKIDDSVFNKENLSY